MLGHVIKQFQVMNVHQEIIAYINVLINNYRLTQLSIFMDDECHEHSHHLRDRSRLHRRGAVVAGNEVAARERVVGPSNFD